jgi:hypothetical protein
LPWLPGAPIDRAAGDHEIGDERARMPITYTNRKGVTYLLYRTVTGAGVSRYVFAREARGEPVEVLPEGHTITESVNGQVSLTKHRPSPILPAEVASVEAAVRRHPRAANYRVGIKGKTIEVYERAGPDMDELVAIFAEQAVGIPASRLASARVEHDRRARFKPVLRFILQDAAQRRFHPQRWCYLGRIDGWLSLLATGSLEQLAARLVPALGTDEFFELH